MIEMVKKWTVWCGNYRRLYFGSRNFTKLKKYFTELTFKVKFFAERTFDAVCSLNAFWSGNFHWTIFYVKFFHWTLLWSWHFVTKCTLKQKCSLIAFLKQKHNFHKMRFNAFQITNPPACLLLHKFSFSHLV